MTIEDEMFEFYEGVSILGPGSESTTKKLISLIPGLETIDCALDIGCGTGRTSLVIAEAGIHVTAIDIYQPFLDHLTMMAKKAKIENNIDTARMSMDNLSLPEKSFDLIWSEASAYVIGVNKALPYWRRFLKPNGYMVLTELCWDGNKHPKELSDFWAQEYPSMRIVDDVKVNIQSKGYDILQTFSLPESDWSNYYEPLKNRIEKYANDPRPGMQYVVKSTLTEISMRQKYYKDYNYTAFILKLSRKTN